MIGTETAATQVINVSAVSEDDALVMVSAWAGSPVDGSTAGYNDANIVAPTIAMVTNDAMNAQPSRPFLPTTSATTIDATATSAATTASHNIEPPGSSASSRRGMPWVMTHQRNPATITTVGIANRIASFRARWRMSPRVFRAR